MQARLDRLAVDQHTIAINLDHAWAAGCDVDRRGTGHAVIDGQGVAGAIHDAHRTIRASPQQPRLAHDAIIVRGKKTQPPKAVFHQTLAVQLLGVVADLVLILAFGAAMQLAASYPRPLAQAALQFEGITP
ncbi:hypothetical protein D3C76_1070700 [compost metagenome]